MTCLTRIERLLVFVSIAALLATLALSARAADEQVWTLGGLEDKNADSIYLGYGATETDDNFGSFTCMPGSGVVKIWIAETNENLTPGKPAKAALSVGAAKAKISGRLIPNEEAGVPSFEGSLKASDPIFAAMASGVTLEVVVGASKQSAPLAGAAEKFKKFSAACAKP